MTRYFIIKALLLGALCLMTWALVRPVRSQSSLALRRLATAILMVCAAAAVVFPQVANTVARAIGVERGVNLLTYGLIVAFFAQSVTTYRRDTGVQRQLTALARQVALASARPPHAGAGAPPSGAEPPSGSEGGGDEVQRAAPAADIPRNEPYNDMVATDE
ncbi:PF10066 family protein [Schaalia georgiae F0490]|uniref:PF10066 family protein n=2 Tax=Schaalia georgiae TaxID=52768 RepID=J0NL34_9ACTO|nr:DUF2304 domain-containing protein [Schaalia georgiae]EJF47849.1 PF10066 family protein [Schaalia georgiae F0490]